MIKWTRHYIKPSYRYTKITQPRIELEAEEEDCCNWLKNTNIELSPSVYLMFLRIPLEN